MTEQQKRDAKAISEAVLQVARDEGWLTTAEAKALREEAATWKQGVGDANRISQRERDRALAAEEEARGLTTPVMSPAERTACRGAR